MQSVKKKSNVQLVKENKELRDDISLLINLPYGHPLKKLIGIKYEKGLTKHQFKEFVLQTVNNDWKIKDLNPIIDESKEETKESE